VTPPLAGRRILVTRAAQQAGKLSESLRALGAVPVEVPVLEILPPASYDPLDQALRHLYGYDWLILTSANTVRAIVERAAVLKIALPPGALHIAAVGQATAEAARNAGLKVTLTPENYVAESLVKALAERIHGKHVLLARAAIARDLIPDALRKSGATVNVVDAYRNLVPAATADLLRSALAQGIEAATFTSSSSASHLAEAARKAGICFPFAGVAAVSIGPITSQTLRELGWPPAAEAENHDIPGLIAALLRHFPTSSEREGAPS
jgi:uroporphyrinogen-III synthase/uroporphyrinogen III methyltransferase/synthase